MTDTATTVILLLNDEEQVLDLMQCLLEKDGYRVDAARSERQAVECAGRRPPQLLLLHLSGSAETVIAASRRIREDGNLPEQVPIVLFCIDGLQGAEVQLDDSLYVSDPDNFDALRQLLRRLLRQNGAP